MSARRSKVASGAGSRRALSAAARRHRPRPLPRGVRRRDYRGSGLARARLGRAGATPVRAFRRLPRARSTGSMHWECSIPAFAPGAKSRPRSRGPAARRKARRGRPIPAPAGGSSADERSAKERAGVDYALRLDLVRALSLTQPARLDRRGRRSPAPSTRRARAARRCRAGAQGYPGKLSPRGHRRRRDPRGDAGYPRRGSRSRHAHPPRASGAARAADPAISSPPAC